MCLQCFDAVGWAAGTTSGLYKTEWWGAGVVICLERGADLHTAQLMSLPLIVSCFSKIQIGLPFWYRLTRVVPDKGPLNGRVCVLCLLQAELQDCQMIETVCAVHRSGSVLVFRSVCLSVAWLGSRLVSVLDSGAEGLWFKSQARRCRVTGEGVEWKIRRGVASSLVNFLLQAWQSLGVCL